MKQIVTKIIAQEILDFNEAYELIYAIHEESIGNEQLASILTGIQIRGVQIEEVKGFRKALLELSIQPQLDGTNAIDLCGTGGDGKNTFNISTTTSLVLAAMGHRVIKHGNYGISSLCGSSNVIEELGFTFTTDEKKLADTLQKTNIAFLHAPLFHPTLKKVAPLRKGLGVPTVFNVMGPLVNPVQPRFQMTGTFNLELAKLYQHVLKNERTNYKVVFGMDGYDELTLTDATRIIGRTTDEMRYAKSFNLQAITPSEIAGGKSIKQAASIVRSILQGQGSYQQTNIIAANVAEAMHCFQPQLDLNECFFEAQYFIRSGQAAKHFKLN